MTTISKLFSDTRQMIPNLSGRTEHFTDLDIAGQRFHGVLSIGKNRRRRPPTWNCSIAAHHNEREIVIVFGAEEKDAVTALNKAEKGFTERAMTVMEFMP